MGAEDVCPEEGPDGLGPPSQLLMSGCWMTTAQLSMMLGAMADVLPLAAAQGVTLGPGQVSRMWGYMRSLALTTKHNGATERSQPGLLALACRCGRFATVSCCDAAVLYATRFSGLHAHVLLMRHALLCTTACMLVATLHTQCSTQVQPQHAPSDRLCPLWLSAGGAPAHAPPGAEPG